MEGTGRAGKVERFDCPALAVSNDVVQSLWGMENNGDVVKSYLRVKKATHTAEYFTFVTCSSDCKQLESVLFSSAYSTGLSASCSSHTLCTSVFSEAKEKKSLDGANGSPALKPWVAGSTVKTTAFRLPRSLVNSLFEGKKY